MTDAQHWYRTVYLQSPHWKKLRKKKLKINPGCERCNKKTRPDVHHVRYRNLYDVTVADLVTLCRGCHKHVHKVFPKEQAVDLLRAIEEARRVLGDLRERRKEFEQTVAVRRNRDRTATRYAFDFNRGKATVRQKVFLQSYITDFPDSLPRLQAV